MNFFRKLCKLWPKHKKNSAKKNEAEKVSVEKMIGRKLNTRKDFLDGFLSSFDISGTILMSRLNREEFLSRGLEHDVQQLMEDQKRLYEDYRKATERVMKTRL